MKKKFFIWKKSFFSLGCLNLFSAVIGVNITDHSKMKYVLYMQSIAKRIHSQFHLGLFLEYDEILDQIFIAAAMHEQDALGDFIQCVEDDIASKDISELEHRFNPYALKYIKCALEVYEQKVESADA